MVFQEVQLNLKQRKQVLVFVGYSRLLHKFVLFGSLLLTKNWQLQGLKRNKDFIRAPNNNLKDLTL